MSLKREFARVRLQLGPLSFYERFEQVCVLILTGLIAVIVVLSLWHLALNILLSILSSTFDPSDYAVFQNVFGTIFTVIIALEFKRSLLLPAYRSFGIVQVRTVILIALLAVVRKLIIIDISTADAFHLLALAAAILALGVVYWIVRESDPRLPEVGAGS